MEDNKDIKGIKYKELNFYQNDKDKPQYYPPLNGFSISNDDVNVLISKIGYLKKQLLLSLIDEYGEIEYDEELFENLVKLDNIQNNIVYDNLKYRENENNVFINANIPVGWNILDTYLDKKEIFSSPADGEGGVKVTINSADFGKYAIGNWDVARSINHLIKNSHKDSVHRCATYVKNALVAGGFPYIQGDAHNLHTDGILGSMGFSHIETIPNNQGNSWTSMNGKPGDIAVYWPEGSGKYGHVCMWTGDQWISDFRQRNIWVYRSLSGDIWMYRYSGG